MLTLMILGVFLHLMITLDMIDVIINHLRLLQLLDINLHPMVFHLQTINNLIKIIENIIGIFSKIIVILACMDIQEM